MAAGLLVLSCVPVVVPSVAGPPATASERRQALPETLCWILADPSAYDGKLVEIEAAIVSDGLEHIQLVDESCPGIALPIVLERRGTDPAIDRLITRAYRRGMTGDDRPISATFSGVVEHVPDKVPSVSLTLTGVAAVATAPEDM